MSKVIVPQRGDDLKALARLCDALYICPKDHVGKRLGPMVAYAGKSPDGKNLIGDIYFNFRRIECHPLVVEQFAEVVAEKIIGAHIADTLDTVCGIPEGGRSLAQPLARILGKRFVYATKVPKPTEQGKKQEYTWDLSQFAFAQKERLLVVEDVINNLQNTDKTREQIALTGGEVVILSAALKRSPFADTEYIPRKGPYADKVLPIVAAIREPYPEYSQTDSAVVGDVAAGNVEFGVKNNWTLLMVAMECASGRKVPDSGSSRFGGF